MGIKDTLRNIRDTKEFVINVVSWDLLEPMNMTAIDCPPEIDEFTLAGLSKAASLVVHPPRVGNAKAVMECRLRQMLTMGDAAMIFGDVLHVGISDLVWVDGSRGYFTAAARRPPCRLPIRRGERGLSASSADLGRCRSVRARPPTKAGQAVDKDD